MKKVLIINYPISDKDFRLRILHNLLIEKYDVTVLANPLWVNTKKKLIIAKRPFLLLAEIVKYAGYILHVFKSLRQCKYDHIIVGYPAYFEIFILRLYFLFSFKRRSIFTDFFLSGYDTLVLDRKIVKAKSLSAYAYFCLDKLLLQLSYCIITDTNTNSARYAKLFNVNIAKFKRIIVGSMLTMDSVYEEIVSGDGKIDHNGKIFVGWVGSFIALHGIDKIIESARELSGENIEYHIIGNSSDDKMEYFKKTVGEMGICNVKFYGELNYKDSIELLSNCDICLGVFGDSDKAKSVIPFKIFDYLNLNQLIVTQASEAIKEISGGCNIFQVDNFSECIAEKIKEIALNIANVKINDSRRILKNMIIDDIQRCFYIK